MGERWLEQQVAVSVINRILSGYGMQVPGENLVKEIGVAIDALEREDREKRRAGTLAVEEAVRDEAPTRTAAGSETHTTEEWFRRDTVVGLLRQVAGGGLLGKHSTQNIEAWLTEQVSRLPNRVGEAPQETAQAAFNDALRKSGIQVERRKQQPYPELRIRALELASAGPLAAGDEPETTVARAEAFYQWLVRA